MKNSSKEPVPAINVTRLQYYVYSVSGVESVSSLSASASSVDEQLSYHSVVSVYFGPLIFTYSILVYVR